MYKPLSLPGMMLDPANPINRGLVAWWPLNEGGGIRANDISGKGNIGNLSGSAKWAGGMNSNGVYFDAVSSEVTTTTNYGTCASLVTMTLSAWVNTSDTVTGGKKIVGIESTQTGTGATGHDRTLSFGQDGYLHGRIYDGASKQVTSLRTINDSKWHHAVLTVTNNVSISLYLDGQFQGSAGIGATYTGYANSWLRIGGYKNLLGAPYYGIDGYFLGFINNVRVWNRALSATEIVQLYTQPSIGLYSPNIGKYFVSAGALATSLFDGKIIIKSSGTNLLDGKVQIKDVVTALLDGKVAIGSVQQSLLDGKLTVKDTAVSFLDGKVMVKDIATSLLDGKLEITQGGVGSDLLDGKIQIKDALTALVDGKVIVKSVATDLLDGKLTIGTSATGVFDGKVQIKDIATALLDGKIQVKNATVDLLDGKIIISDGVTSFSKNNQLLIDSIGGKVLQLGNTRINSWNTAGRPASPKTGTIGLNTQTVALDIYDGSNWKSVTLS